MWLSAYVLDFLTRAKTLGYTVPQYNITKGLDWIEDHLNRWNTKGKKQEADIYGLYVLTRAGRILMSEIDYYSKGKTLVESAQSWGHLGATLATIGEKSLAKSMFSKAKKALNASYKKSYSYRNYGGALRNHASLISLMQEAKIELNWHPLFADLSLNVKAQKYLSTQELSTLLRLAFLSETASQEEMHLLVDNQALVIEKGDYVTKSSSLETLASVSNEGNSPLWYDMSFKATADAKSYDVSLNQGFSIQKTLYTLEGKKIDVANIQQNERIVVVIEGKIEHYSIENPLITDWIPSGFELENPHLSGIYFVSTLKWIGTRSAVAHDAYRNDRFEVALNLEYENNNSFKVAYIARAVSQGVFTFPPAQIEDMYQPRYRALSRFLQKPIRIVPVLNYVDTTGIGGLLMSDFNRVSTTVMTPTLLAQYDKKDLRILRNSLFARYGRTFKEPTLTAIFRQMSWYKPRDISVSEIFDVQMNTLEKDNILLMLKLEKSR
ncbi:MAG: YARHG domain-containing protein [Sulfurovum sp.]|nr:YARHG domain-containing protein [Sulfurovum sp.]